MLRGPISVRGVCVGLWLLPCLSVFAFSEPTFAQEPPAEEPIFIDFDYEAPEGCLDRDSAFSLVHRRSRRVELSPGSDAPQTLVMQIRERGGEFVGVLAVRRPEQPEERRAMSGARCEEVVEALALTAALSIDPNATLTLGDPEASAPDEDPVIPEAKTEPQNAPARQPAGERTISEDPARADKDRPRAKWALGASLVTQRVMDHAIHLGGALDLSLAKTNDARWFFPLEGRLSLRALFEPTVGEPGVITQLYLGSLSYCPIRWGVRQAVLFCPFVQVGVVRATSVGFAEETSANRSFATAGAEVVLRAFVTETVQMWVAPAVLAPVTKRDFGVNPGPEILASTLDVGFSVATGVGYTF